MPNKYSRINFGSTTRAGQSQPQTAPMPTIVQSPIREEIFLPSICSSSAQEEFKKGFAEELPVPDGSVDVIISNGVLNLTPDKYASFIEVFRVLKPGGRLYLADVVVYKPVPDAAKEIVDLWTA